MKTRLLSGASFGVMAALVGIMGLASAEPALGVEEPLAITVLVANYSQASPAVLAAAEREAGRILSGAGLRTVWLECRVGSTASKPQGPCERAAEATDIRLRVLAAPIQKEFGHIAFGFTFHPVLASVYYELVVRRAKSGDFELEVPTILGCAIAHELGHLLLGPNGHSAGGIMQGQWDPKQLHMALMGGLVFTSQQSKVLRAAARARIEHQKDGLSSPSSTQ